MNQTLKNILSKVENKIANIQKEINSILIEKGSSKSNLHIEITNGENCVMFPLEYNGEIYQIKLENPNSECKGYWDFDVYNLWIIDLMILASRYLNIKIIESNLYPQNSITLASFSFGE